MAKVILDFERPIIELEQKIIEMRKYADNLDIADEIATLESKVDQLRQNVYNNLTRWQRVQLARHPDRPYTLDYIQMMLEDFIELHGDRRFGDDKAIIGG
jgi:acetyl-CoA carboxylase carboxyl transferase subunit alpha